MKINPAERALVKAAQQCSELLSGSRVLVCSGSRLVLTSLCLSTPLLPSVVGGATTEDEAMELYEECQPDILIVGEDLEKGYGIRLVERVKKDRPEVKALIFLNRETPDVVQEAMEAGANGVMFISSIGSGDGDFIRALQTTNAGGVYYPKAVREVMRSRTREPLVLIDPLSTRELDVIRCIIEGKQNQEIAEALFLSPETVKSHMKTMMQKLGVRDRTQAAVLALTRGLVEVDI